MRAIALAITLAASASGAQALSINTTTCTLGGVSCTVGGATVTASGDPGAFLSLVDYRGNSSIGVGPVTSDNRTKEIQGGNAERLTVMYNRAQRITRIGLSVFYNPQEFSGDPEEIANITATGLLGMATLSIKNTDNSAMGFSANDSSLFGSLSRLSTFQGTFEITDLFKSLGGITKLEFFASNTPKGGDNSDFAVSVVDSVAVPLPAGGLLLMGGLLVLGRLRKLA